MNRLTWSVHVKNFVGLFLALATILQVGAVRAADIGAMAWDESNIAVLRSLSKADLLAFFNTERSKAGDLEPMTANEIGQFTFADLDNTGKYQLILTLSEPCVQAIDIEKRYPSGKVRSVQIIQGVADLKTGIRDLNGDGKDELIIGKTLAEYSCAGIVTWPAVYRLENGKYVEASRDFPKFYDDEALPKLDAEISEYRAKQAQAGTQDEWNPAGFIMVRDKILRVLGRDPTAGLDHAREWMKTDDRYLLLYAVVTLKDIGGHQAELAAAQASYRRAQCVRYPDLAMCKKLGPH